MMLRRRLSPSVSPIPRDPRRGPFRDHLRGMWLVAATASAMLPTCALLFDGDAVGFGLPMRLLMAGAAWAAAWWGWRYLRPSRETPLWRPGGPSGVLTAAACLGILAASCFSLSARVSQWRTLSDYARLGCVDALGETFDRGVDPNLHAPNGPLSPLADNESLLEIAVQNEQAPTVALLLRRGARVNDGRGQSPALADAALNGDTEDVAALLRRGANPNTKIAYVSGNEPSALRLLSCVDPAGDVAKLLRQYGAAPGGARE